MIKRTIVALGLALTLASCGGAVSRTPPEMQTVSGHGTPSERYDSLESAVRASDAVVLASVSGIAPGRSVSAGGVTVAFTNVTLRIMGTSASVIAVGSTVMIEQTGGPTPKGTLIDQDDPPYVIGEQAVLLLRKIPNGYRTVAPLGRFRVQAGRLQAVASIPASQAWTGRSVAELMSLAQQVGH